MRQSQYFAVFTTIGFNEWKIAIEKRIETVKVNVVISVNAQMLALYHSIGRDILQKQKQDGRGAQVIKQLSNDEKFVQVPLAQITWCHHISLIPKEKILPNGHSTLWKLLVTVGIATR